MPKSKTKRKQPTGPYSGKKREAESDSSSKATSGQLENSETYDCDACAEAVDRLIQCE